MNDASCGDLPTLVMVDLGDPTRAHGAVSETANHHTPTHPHLAAALLMIGIVVFLLVVSVVSVR